MDSVMTASLVHDPSGHLQCPVVEVDTDSLDFSKLLAGEICTSSLSAEGMTGLCHLDTAAGVFQGQPEANM